MINHELWLISHSRTRAGQDKFIINNKTAEPSFDTRTNNPDASGMQRGGAAQRRARAAADLARARRGQA